MSAQVFVCRLPSSTANRQAELHNGMKVTSSLAVTLITFCAQPGTTDENSGNFRVDIESWQQSDNKATFLKTGLHE